MRLVAFVMDVELAVLRHELLVKRMPDPSLDVDDARPVQLVGHDHALDDAPPVSGLGRLGNCRHFSPPPSWSQTSRGSTFPGARCAGGGFATPADWQTASP